MKNKNSAHENLKPGIPGNIIRAANWTVRVLLAVLIVFSVWPYLPKNYSPKDIPYKYFPILVLGVDNKPEIISLADWESTDPRPFMWTDKGSGQARMRSMAFSYSVDLEPSGVIRVTLKRNDADHMVAADYKIVNGKMMPVRYHSMDPGIAFVFILGFIAWGVLGFVRKIVLGILGRLLKR